LSDGFVNFELDFHSKADQFFEYAGFRARDMRDPMRQTANALLHYERLIFDSEGVALLGHRWQELAPKYKAWKDASAYAGRPILQLTRELYHEAISRHNTHVGKDFFSYEVPVEHGVWHQEGDPSRTARLRDGRIVPNPLPQRQWFEWDEIMHDQAETIFHDWLEGLMHRNTRRSGGTNPAL
jgi:hypothetical protein